MNSVKEYAYAKINLYLDVISKRDDGFHDIKTVMHTVSLADEITVTVKPASKSEIRLTLGGNNKIPQDSRNLAYRAAELFLSSALMQLEVSIKLDKHIPVAAGLAGGSADAAAVLRALNRICKKPFTEKKLLSLAAELGSDVPFCLLGGTALCLGRGERIERLPDKLSLHTVVAIADEHVSTPAAYASLDEIFEDFKVGRTDDPEAHYVAIKTSLENGKLDNRELYNIFENAVFPICSGAELLKSKMKELGATHSLMSGSGPSVFGIFSDADTAAKARDALLADGFRAFTAHSI